MVGSAPDVRGGVSAVARVYREQGLFDRTGAVYLPTHCDGSAARKAAFALRAWLVFGGRLLGRRVALLHVHLNSGASFWRKALFAWPARALGVPYVLHVHCGRFGAFYAASPGWVQRAIRDLLRRADAVIALTPEGAAALDAIVPGLAIDTIPNPVAVPSWQAPLSSSPPVVLFMGVLTEAKGVHDLLAAWTEVVKRLPAARLVLAGSGDLAALARRTEALGIAGSVAMPGWIGAEERERLLREASVFVLPSHHEAMPMSLLEAGAAGLPVVATPVGGIPSIVEDGRNGRLVPVRDPATLAKAIAGLLLDRERARALGAALRHDVAGRYSAERVVPAVEALWARVMRRTPGSMPAPCAPHPDRP